MGPELVALAGAAAATQTGLTLFTANEQNKAIQDAQNANAQAAAVRNQQLVNQSALEKAKQQRQAAQIEARIRVAAGQAGTSSSSGTFAALLQQADTDSALNLDILDTNLQTQLAASNAGQQADATRLQSSAQNPLLAGISGALSGTSTGLSLAGGIQQLNKPPS